MAIAFDSASGSFVNPASSHTQAHTCSGANRALWVNVVADPTSDLITGATYNGVAMTLIASGASSGRWLYLFYLAAPATGANNIVVSASSSTYIEINAASYTGVSQTGQPEATNSDFTGTGISSKSVSVTTITDNAWALMSGRNQSGGAGGGSGTTLRNAALVGSILDSGGPVTPAGSKTLTLTQASASEMGGIVVSMAPAASGTDATATGVTFTATSSLIPGSATGQAGATASGVTFTATSSLIAGSASGVINGTLNFQAAGMEFGRRTGLGISTFALDNGASYRYTVHADALTLGGALHTSAAITLDSAGKLPNYVGSAVAPGTTYRVVAIRQADGEACIFRMTAA